MSTSISTPSSLATFQQPHASTSKLPHVTLSSVEGGEGNYAVAAVQGDGVWTYDLRTMRPSTSYTVPPSTTFSCPPISFHCTTRGKDKAKASADEGMDVDDAAPVTSLQRITAIALEKGEGVSKTTARKVVWIWTGEDEDRQAVTLAEPVAGLHRIAHPTFPILAVHSASSFSLVSPTGDEASHVKVTSKPVSTADILSSQILLSTPDHTRCLLVDSHGAWTLVSIENGVALKQKEGRLTDDKRRFVSASISKDGVISAADSNSHLVSKHMNEPTSASFPTLLHPTAAPISLSLPTFGKPLAILPTLHPAPSILLTIASSSLPALLSKAPITGASSNTSISHLAHLGNVSPNVLIVGIVLHHSMEDGGRSVLYSCEVTIPQKGIGLNALLGSQARTEEYISLPTSGSSTESTGVDRQAEVRDKCLDEITTALTKGETKAATARLNDLLSGQDSVLPEHFVTKLVNVVFKAAMPDFGKEGEVESKKRGPYASKIMATLLQKGAVNDEMLKGGVVSAGLLPLADWDNIFIALPLLRTTPSSTLVSLIKAVLREPTAAGTPSIATILEAILALPPPPPTYRVELKRGLGVEDATSVLEILAQWAEAWVASNTKGLRWDIGQATTAESEATLPSLEAVLTHSSLLLDSHTPLFLSHPPSYPFLARLQAALEPLLLMQADYRALRAPLEAVLTLSKRAERTREEQQRKSEVSQGAFGKRGKGQATQNKQADVLAKTMGEGKVGKWKVEDFVF